MQVGKFYNRIREVLQSYQGGHSEDSICMYMYLEVTENIKQHIDYQDHCSNVYIGNNFAQINNGNTR